MNRKQIKQKAATYPKFVEWSPEDECFIGRCPILFSGGIHGNDEAKVYADLCRATEEWVEAIFKDGHPFPESGPNKWSGQFVLRVDPATHRKLALKAKAEGKTLNGFCYEVLSEA